LGRRDIGVCALLIASAASAASDEVARYIRAARGFYEALEYEHALEQLARAKTLPRTLDEDVVIALYEGVIEGDLSHPEEAVNAFRAGLYLKPDAALPVPVSPKVEAVFEQTRTEVKVQIARGEPPPAPRAAPTGPPPPSIAKAAEPAPPRESTYRAALLVGTANFQSLGLAAEARLLPRWTVGAFGFAHSTSVMHWLYIGLESSFIPLGHFGNGLLVGGQVTGYAEQYAGQSESPTYGGIGPHIGYRACTAFGLTGEAKLRLDFVANHDARATLALAAGWSFL
jgi:hypothetical protein